MWSPHYVRTLGSQRYLPLLLYIMQRNGDGSLHELCPTSLPSTIVRGASKAIFETCSTITAFTPSLYVFFSFLRLPRLEYRADRHLDRKTLPTRVRSQDHASSSWCLCGTTNAFRNISADSQLAASSDPTSYVICLFHHFSLNSFAGISFTFQIAFFSPK